MGTAVVPQQCNVGFLLYLYWPFKRLKVDFILVWAPSAPPIHFDDARVKCDLNNKVQSPQFKDRVKSKLDLILDQRDRICKTKSLGLLGCISYNSLTLKLGKYKEK